MASPLDEMTKLLAGLATGSNSKKTVESLKTVVASISPSELREYVPKIDIDRLFTCFATSDREQVELTCDLLSHILGCFDENELLAKYQDLFLEGLSHPQMLVKELILRQLQKIADHPVAAVSLSSSLELVTTCLQLVGSDDISIASKAVRVLISLTKHAEAGNVFVKPAIIKEMQEVGQKNDVVRYRIYEIIVALGTSSAEKLSFAHDAKLIQMLVEEASTNDILVQLNALELLRNLVAIQHGRDYLEKERFVEALMNQLSNSASDPLASLIIPGLMKFFGTLAHFQPEVLTKYPIFTDTLFQMLDDADLALVMVAMETVAFIATGIEGKPVLFKLGNRMDNALIKVGQLLNHASNDVRLKTLNSLAELIQVPRQEENIDEVMKVVEHWFNLLGKSPVSLVLNILKQPFKDLRLGALNVFFQLSSQPWAQKLMNDQAGFVEFLVDRRAEPDKECLERKFEIVQSIVDSPTSAEIFSHYSMAEMRDHVREGPWFVHAQSSVAFESGP